MRALIETQLEIESDGIDMRYAVLYGTSMKEKNVRRKITRQLGCDSPPDVQNSPDAPCKLVIGFDHAKRVNAVFTFGI